MTNIKLITVCSHPEHAEVLRRSAELYGWDFVCIHVPEWKGFGTKLIATYEYLKQHPEIDRFVFADAFDVVTLGNRPIIFHPKIVFSAEKGCWPDDSLRDKYPPIANGSEFKFLNSGLFYAETSEWLKMIEQNPPEYHFDDQLYYTKCFLSSKYNMALDTHQTYFNSHSFISEGEYTYNNGRVQIMGNEPVFVHSNGRSVDPKLDELVKEMLT